MGRRRRQSRRPSSRGSASRRRGGSRGVTITEVGPTGNISGYRPMVQATVKDSETTLSKSDIHVSLDGEEITGFSYQRSTGGLSFTPRKLSSGTHTVEIEADAEGSKTARKSWTFVVG